MIGRSTKDLQKNTSFVLNAMRKGLHKMKQFSLLYKYFFLSRKSNNPHRFQSKNTLAHKIYNEFIGYVYDED